MADARLRNLERAAASGDPDAQVRLDAELLRAGRRHDYRSEPGQVTNYGRYSSVTRLRQGWVMVPRRLVPRSSTRRPSERYDLVTEWREYRGQFSPQILRAVVPELWWLAQAPRVGQAVVDEWLRISRERRAFDEHVIATQRQAEDVAWTELMSLLEGGPQIVRRQLLEPVSGRLSADSTLRAEVVGSRVVVGRSSDARYELILAAARDRSARARRAAITRRQRINTTLGQTGRQHSPRPQTRPTQPRPPRDEASSARWAEALELLRGLVDSGDGLAIGTTPQLRLVMCLPSTAATSELLAALRDGQVPSAADLFCVRSGDEWLITS